MSDECPRGVLGNLGLSLAGLVHDGLPIPCRLYIGGDLQPLYRPLEKRNKEKKEVLLYLCVKSTIYFCIVLCGFPMNT